MALNSIQRRDIQNKYRDAIEQGSLDQLIRLFESNKVPLSDETLDRLWLLYQKYHLNSKEDKAIQVFNLYRSFRYGPF